MTIVETPLTYFGEPLPLMRKSVLKLGVFICIAFAVSVTFVAVTLPQIHQTLFVSYFTTLNLITMLFTWQDKSAAINDMPRISELRFYVLACCGGWPGSYLIQQIRRHKTLKQPFRVIFWICSWLNIIVCLVLLKLYNPALFLTNTN